jgi:hypothetical protein
MPRKGSSPLFRSRSPTSSLPRRGGACREMRRPRGASQYERKPHPHVDSAGGMDRTAVRALAQIMSNATRRGNYGHAVVRAVGSSTIKRDGERRFPHQVDIPVPGSDFGRHLAEMLEWCSGNVVAGMWSQHGHSAGQAICPAASRDSTLRARPTPWRSGANGCDEIGLVVPRRVYPLAHPIGRHLVGAASILAHPVPHHF